MALKSLQQHDAEHPDRDPPLNKPDPARHYLEPPRPRDPFNDLRILLSSHLLEPHEHQ